MKLSETQVKALFERGNNFVRMGNLKAAIGDYDQVLAQQPDFAPAYFNRGFARQHGAGDVAGAIADYGAALRLKPDFPEALVNRAIAQAGQGDLAAALDDYAAALGLNANAPQVYVNRGEIYLLQESYAAAEADFRQALALKAGYRYAVAGLALACFAQARQAEALELWAGLLARNPNFGDVAWVQAELGWDAGLADLADRICIALAAQGRL